MFLGLRILYGKNEFGIYLIELNSLRKLEKIKEKEKKKEGLMSSP